MGRRCQIGARLGQESPATAHELNPARQGTIRAPGPYYAALFDDSLCFRCLPRIIHGTILTRSVNEDWVTSCPRLRFALGLARCVP